MSTCENYAMSVVGHMVSKIARYIRDAGMTVDRAGYDDTRGSVCFIVNMRYRWVFVYQDSAMVVVEHADYACNRKRFFYCDPEYWDKLSNYLNLCRYRI